MPIKKYQLNFVEYFISNTRCMAYGDGFFMAYFQCGTDDFMSPVLFVNKQRPSKNQALVDIFYFKSRE
ncbi:MAG: hypothetical protein A2381_01540 [Bdellovibrionales bacterium RIFOXYB1_FULL_37_110]|nr:MAG: hypothetical protein A2417_02395 [Bdellovibrionales bacterium RIFOXYC1_FULL_37_79]OFZ58899.1 MAG: hypothetical protein A2381_01540 [Bdellovibrionales bacterium RIFOXYB1_FULL_37_110]OFZ64655.1 MAG: hypothetical protein A2577_13395 [Bdellovibrionales bacterium RIFOXYD1_FULL_36_51]